MQQQILHNLQSLNDCQEREVKKLTVWPSAIGMPGDRKLGLVF